MKKGMAILISIFWMIAFQAVNSYAGASLYLKNGKTFACDELYKEGDVYRCEKFGAFLNYEMNSVDTIKTDQEMAELFEARKAAIEEEKRLEKIRREQFEAEMERKRKLEQARIELQKQIESEKRDLFGSESNIRNYCENQWRDNYDQAQYCFEQQTESMNVLFGEISAEGADRPLIDRCLNEWRESRFDTYNFEQVLYCVNTQLEAKARLDEIAHNDEITPQKLLRCIEQWRDQKFKTFNYTQVVYCSEN